MKRLILPVSLITLLVLGCGRFSGDSSNSAGNQANTTPAMPIKQVDIPNLWGKSKDEVKAALSNGRVTYDRPDAISVEFPDGTTFDAHYVDPKNKSLGNSMTFKLPVISTGSGIESLSETPEKLAEMAGIDLKGKTPSSDIGSNVFYQDEKMNGKPVEITLSRSDLKGKNVSEITVREKK